MSLQTVNYLDSIIGSDTIVDELNLTNLIAISLDRLANGLNRGRTIQKLICVLYQRRLFTYYNLGGAWVYMQVFALLKIGKSWVHNRALLELILKFTIGLIKLPEAGATLTADNKVLIIKLFLFCI